MNATCHYTRFHQRHAEQCLLQCKHLSVCSSKIIWSLNLNVVLARTFENMVAVVSKAEAAAAAASLSQQLRWDSLPSRWLESVDERSAWACDDATGSEPANILGLDCHWYCWHAAELWRTPWCEGLPLWVVDSCLKHGGETGRRERSVSD